jgi:spore coat protein JB
MVEITRKEMMNKIRELEFAAVDLNLYLDTHPTCQQALMDYNTISQQLNELKKIYETKYEPLVHFGCAPSQYPWKWVCDPWPWEDDEMEED